MVIEEASYAKPVPLPDRDSAEYWRRIAAHELSVQRCSNCGGYRWPAREVCGLCASMDYEWVKVSGRGSILSWTIIHNVTAPGFRVKVPYNVALIQLEESPDLVVIGDVLAENDALRQGLRVVAEYDDVTNGVTLVRWAPSV